MGEVEQALLASIIAAPDDDVPRLVYADWLQERGDPRGELIALQVTGRDPLRVEQLLADHGARWAGDLAPLVRSYTFTRGFIDAIDVAVATFVDHHDVISASAPLLRALHFNQCRSADEARRLFACPVLACARRLSLYGSTVGEALAELVASPYVENVERLQLSHGFTGERIVDLTRSRHLGRLRALSVNANHIGADAAAALIDGFPLVRSFAFAATGFAGTWIQPAAAGAIDFLGATSNQLGTAAAVALAGSALRPLSLDLGMNRLGVKAAAALLPAPVFARIEYLHLANNMLGDVGARLLATLPQFASLRHADLRSNRITDAGKDLLRRRFGDVVAL